MDILDGINRIRFRILFLLIIISILLFGIFYYFITIYSLSNGLYGDSQITIYESMYFSVVTFTSLGLGDIKPLGFSKLLTSIQVILGLISFGVIISKLVSYRQEKIIDRLFLVTLETRLREIRDNLQINRLKLKEITIKKLHSPEDKKIDIELKKLLKGKDSTLNRLHSMITGTHGFLRNLIEEKKSMGVTIDVYEIERIYYSIYLSVKEIRSSFDRLDEVKFYWRKSNNISRLRNIIKFSDSFSQLIDKHFESDEIDKIEKMLNSEIKLLKELLDK